MTRAGQLRLDVPGLERRPHPTGQQAPCERCAAAGGARQGVSRAGPSSPPLCLPCWRSDQDREARAAVHALVTQGWDEIGEAERACPACWPAPVADCWWCGDRTWLDWVRRVHEQDQAAAAAAEAARVAAEFDRLAAVADTEARIEDLSGWITRISRDVLGRWHDGSGGRAIDRAAAALAAMHAARTSTRGRPPVVRELIAVIWAVDADWRSGRRAMPGQARAAWFAGASVRATINAIHGLIRDAGVQQTHRGGRNTLARRVATGRWNDRSVYDLPPLGRTAQARAARAAHIPRVLTLLAVLLDRAQMLLAAEHVELDRLRAAAGPPSWAEHARRAQLRQATRHAATRARALAETVTTEANKCTPHPVSRGECVSSCPSWGLGISQSAMIHSPECPGKPADGRRQGGASRSPTERGGTAGRGSCGMSTGRPRTPAHRRPVGPFRPEARSAPSQRRARPSWADWAYDLARELIRAVPWLAGARVPAVAAVLGARLGLDWTVRAVLALLPRDADPDRPLALLAAALDRALTGDQAPAYPSRRHDEHRRAMAATAAARAAARLADTLAELDTHAAASTGAGLAAFRAARAQLGHRTSPAGREAWPAVAPPGGGLPEHWRHGADRHDHAEGSQHSVAGSERKGTRQ